MKKWYQEPFVNRRDWILENIQYLGITGNELMIVLLIDYFHQQNKDITVEYLSKHTGFTTQEVDRIVSLLCYKNYLVIKPMGNKIDFVIDGIFEANIATQKDIAQTPIYDLIAQEFKRTLSSTELQKISDWTRIYDQDMIVDALREASVYQKLRIEYIDAILKDWNSKKEKGIQEKRNQ